MRVAIFISGVRTRDTNRRNKLKLCDYEAQQTKKKGYKSVFPHRSGSLFGAVQHVILDLLS